MVKKLILLFLFLFTICHISNAQIFEAENATLSDGATVVKNASCSGAAFVQLKGGQLEMKITLEAEGFFDIYINAASSGNKKINGFAINGSSVDFTLDQTTYSNLKVVSGLKLSKGEHSIGIINSWGWINIDFFEFKQVEAGERFKINKTLVTPSPTTQAQKLYDFLYDNYGEKIISGVMTLNSMDEINWLQSKTGKKPALVGIDFLHCGRGYTWYDNNTPMNDALNYYNSNGIPALCWHWRDPSRKTEEFYTKSTSFDINKIFDPESDDYKAMIEDIDYISQFLLQLQNDSVAVLWRPLHEAAGGWFWWGAKGAAPCKALWQIMFDRMVNHNGVRNLIWVWTREPNDEAWYPGDEYVDIVGRDIYKDGDHSSQVLEFNQMNDLYGGNKMLSVSECGSFPDPDELISDGAAWSFFMPWYGDFVRKDKYNSMALWKKTLTHDYVITLDQMPNLRQYEKQKTNDVFQIGSSMNVYPTRFNNEINISNNQAIGKISIYNINGILIKNIETSENKLIINTDNFSKGIYFLKSETRKTFKLIK